jgi:hypothetical protein
MKRLAGHYRNMRDAFPEDDLIVVLDVDDTILDLCHMVAKVLTSFDDFHGTVYFRHVTRGDLAAGETGVYGILKGLGIPRRDGQRIGEWYGKNSWSSSVVREAHRPFPGIMELIAWLQRQPRTFVGLNTGRPETIRGETLECLNLLGRRHGAVFNDSLLFMNPGGWNQNIPESKVAGMEHFSKRGYRVVAFFDNEPENLRVIADYAGPKEVLLLHADTVFTSERAILPQGAVSGRTYDTSRLIQAAGRSCPPGQAASALPCKN